MTQQSFRVRDIFKKCAAIFVAQFLFVGALSADEVLFRSFDGAVEVSGEFIGYDGSNITALTQQGLVTFRSDGMICTGNDCPDLLTYVPTVRLVGASRIGDVLMPALIDVYARDMGWSVEEDLTGLRITRSDGSTVIAFEIEIATPDDSFASFATHQADILMSMRELRQDELDAGFQAGLGRLSLARQARILALDALVPVVSPTSTSRDISLADLIDGLSGKSDLYEVHLPEAIGGQIQGFQDRLMQPIEATLSSELQTHETEAELLRAVETGTNRLSLVPYGRTRNTQPLALTGPCGLRSAARFLTLKTEDYPLTFPIFLYLPQRRQHSQVESFLDWLRSPSAQLVIRRAGFVDLAAVPIPLNEQGDRLANAIASAGPEVSLGELQRMVRVLQPRVRMSSTFRFEPGSTRLDGQSRSNVMQLAQAIRDGQFGQRELLFVGFSDGRGPAVANRDLSAARAEAVRRDVERALGGVVPSNVRIDTQAFGEALPMACDDTLWGQQTNRRVELWVRDAD